MERGFDHVTPNVPDEALIQRLESIAEYINDVQLNEEELLNLAREVEHIAWEIDMRNKERIRREEEIAWMEKEYNG